MSLWRRLFRLGALPDVPTAAGQSPMVAQQEAADQRIEDQRDKLRDTVRHVVPGAYRAVDRLGEEVDKALRSIR